MSPVKEVAFFRMASRSLFLIERASSSLRFRAAKIVPATPNNLAVGAI